MTVRDCLLVHLLQVFPWGLSCARQGCCWQLVLMGCLNILQVREIYETAIEAAEPYHLPDADCLKMCTRRATPKVPQQVHEV